MDSTIRQLQQRNEVLEEGIASIRSTLDQATPRALPEIPSGGPTTTRPNEMTHPEQENTPYTSTTTYLLGIHESLREEVSRLSSALSESDARANMSIMNENLRMREDMAHINAALNTVRMQVHMLMNLRSQQGQRSEPSRGVQSPSRPSGSVPEPLRGRRLSDSSREGTKL